MELSRDFTGDTQILNSHGTEVATVVGAAPNNNFGVAGVCWSSKLVSLKVSTVEDSAATSRIIKAIDYADSINVPILNISLGSKGLTELDGEMKKAIENYDGLVICAAGNFNENNDLGDDVAVYPASFDCENIISVASGNEDGTLMYNSNYGANSVDLVAPGRSFDSAGTSIAAPYVAGVAALMKSVKPSLTTAQLKNYILETVDHDVSLVNKVKSGGRLNAYKALLRTNGNLPVNTGVYYIRNEETGEYLEAKEEASGEVALGLSDYTGNSSQQWKVEATDKDTARTILSMVNTSLALDASGGINNLVQIRNASNAQKWKINTTVSSTAIVSDSSKLYLSIGQSGATLEQVNSSKKQRWIFERVEIINQEPVPDHINIISDPYFSDSSTRWEGQYLWTSTTPDGYGGRSMAFYSNQQIGTYSVAKATIGINGIKGEKFYYGGWAFGTDLELSENLPERIFGMKVEIENPDGTMQLLSSFSFDLNWRNWQYKLKEFTLPCDAETVDIIFVCNTAGSFHRL